MISNEDFIAVFARMIRNDGWMLRNHGDQYDVVFPDGAVFYTIYDADQSFTIDCIWEQAAQELFDLSKQHRITSRL